MISIDMRSPLLTILLAIVTTLVCVLAVRSIQRGNLDEILGAPKSMPGELLYPEFDPEAVSQIRISGDGVSATLVRRKDGWRIRRPWSDRADARAAASILQFTQALRVEDSGDVEETDRHATGMRDAAVRVRLNDADGRRLAEYEIGARTPWLASVQIDSSSGTETQTVPTVFIETRDRGRRNHVYICAGDISPLFRDGLGFLRDHRPFYFNPAGVRSIGIATDDGELSLGRESPTHPWRITKPLELATDVTTIRTLLTGLFDLTAVKIEDTTLVATSDTASGRKIRISLTNFAPEGTEPQETTLEVSLPEDPESRFALATVSDRPGISFAIPAKPEADLVSLADLPLTVNSLRDPTLTNINIASLAAIALRPATGPEIQISRDPGRPWIANIVATAEQPAESFPANERRLFELLNAITQSRVVSFESDAAVDLSPWGLDRPVLSLAFLGRDHQLLEIDFGLDGRGGTFANRKGTSTVTRLEDDFLKTIAVRAFEWRQARVWSVSKVDLQKIIRLRTGKPPELLEYTWQDERWSALRGEDDATPELIQTRANFLLDRLEGIECDRWLAADDAAALAALAQPFLRIAIFENEVDDLGDRIGEVRRNIGFAMAPEHPGFFYGILLGDAHPFLIAEDTIRALAIPLFDDE